MNIGNQGQFDKHTTIAFSKETMCMKYCLIVLSNPHWVCSPALLPQLFLIASLGKLCAISSQTLAVVYAQI